MKKYIAKVKKYIILRLIFEALLAGCTASMPLILMNLVDNYQNDLITTQSIAIYIIVYFLLIIGVFIFSIGYNYNQFKMKTKFESNLRRDFFHSLCSINLSTFYNKNIGEYISMNNNEITDASNYVNSIVELISISIELIVYLIVIIIELSWIIALVLVLGSIISVFFSTSFHGRLSTLKNTYLLRNGFYNDEYKNYLEARASINESVRNAVINKHNEMQSDVMNAKMEYYRSKTMSLSLNATSAYSPQLLGLIACAILIYNNMITVGVFIATFSFISYVETCIDSITDSMEEISSHKQVNERIIANFKELEDGKLKKENVETFDEITFNDVSISFNNYNIFHDANFTIEKGKKYALVGKNGSGKSSLIKILLGQNINYEGEIFVDEKDLRKVNLNTNIWYINQKGFDFNDNYQNTVSMYNSFDYKEAIKIDEEIKGYSDVSFIKCKNCNKLSGGQRQLLALERALISKASLLILDEPFSAMDKNILPKVYDYLKKVSDVTLLLVSHDTKEALSWFDYEIEIDDRVVHFNKI